MKKIISTILALEMLVAPAASSICFADDQGDNVIDYVSGQIGRPFENLIPEQVKEWLPFLFGVRKQEKNEVANIEENPQPERSDKALNEKTLQSVNECDELDCSSTTTLTGRDDNIETNIPLAEVTEDERAAEIYVETLKTTERTKIESRLRIIEAIVETLKATERTKNESRLRIIEAISEEVKKEKDAMKLKMYRDVFEVMKLEMNERQLSACEKIFDVMRKEKSATKLEAYLDAFKNVSRETNDKALRLFEKIFDAMRKENQKINEVNVVGGKCEEKLNEFWKIFNKLVVAKEEKDKLYFLEDIENARLSIMKSNGAAYVSETVEASEASEAAVKAKNALDLVKEEFSRWSDEAREVCEEAVSKEVRA